ncbi:MAG: 30S ribosomal protein S7 [Omnitrophica bacterium RBG_13_46_9]|nr:MAG: 30S ribosomal protein S7 [Omnitrophica bacterium RBG_13_46_9]
MRRRRALKRKILPDPKYNSLLLARFINMVMSKGKKSVAETIVYGALDLLAKKTGSKDTVEIFQKAMDNTRPLLEVRPRRIGGATYQVPMEVERDRGNFMAMMWIRDFARAKKGKPMQEKLADELMDAYNKTGGAIKKREDTHKMAEANKAFSHYRW